MLCNFQLKINQLICTNNSSQVSYVTVNTLKATFNRKHVTCVQAALVKHDILISESIN
jgi:hypothetical protein